MHSTPTTGWSYRRLPGAGKKVPKRSQKKIRKRTLCWKSEEDREEEDGGTSPCNPRHFKAIAGWNNGVPDFLPKILLVQKMCFHKFPHAAGFFLPLSLNTKNDNAIKITLWSATQISGIS